MHREKCDKCVGEFLPNRVDAFRTVATIFVAIGLVWAITDYEYVIHPQVGEVIPYLWIVIGSLGVIRAKDRKASLVYVALMGGLIMQRIGTLIWITYVTGDKAWYYSFYDVALWLASVFAFFLPDKKEK